MSKYYHIQIFIEKYLLYCDFYRIFVFFVLEDGILAVKYFKFYIIEKTFNRIALSFFCLRTINGHFLFPPHNLK